jgi:hypothetical protein
MIEAANDVFLLVESVPIDRGKPYLVARRIDDVMTAGVERRRDGGLLGSGQYQAHCEGGQRNAGRSTKAHGSQDTPAKVIATKTDCYLVSRWREPAPDVSNFAPPKLRLATELLRMVLDQC